MKTTVQLMVTAALFTNFTSGWAATHYVDVNSPNPIPPYTNWATAATVIQDAVDAALDGDEVVVTNGLYNTGGRVVYGSLTNRVAVTQPILLRSANGPSATIIQGYQVPGTTNGDAAVRCVYLTNGASLAGFTLMGGGTRDNSGNADYYTEQSGGGVRCPGNEVVSNCVLTSNSAFGLGGGTYGGTLNNCTLSGNSVINYNGGGEGGGAFGSTLNNCILSGNSAEYGGGARSGTLNNCTLSGNSAGYGGGASLATLNNCVLTGNSASGGGGADYGTLNNCTLTANSATVGGGAYSGTLNNCTLTGNRASNSGGGAFVATLTNCVLTGNSAYEGGGAVGGTLNNCTLSGNSAEYGGGAAGRREISVIPCILNNCILYFNTALAAANYSDSTLNYCCTTPLPDGVGNITTAPLFVNQVGANYRLQTNSPCINAGNNAYAPPGPDLDGNPRIAGGTVDIGAYEFQHPTSLISYAWLLQYGLRTDGADDFKDPDGDGLNNWQEWRCGTDPTNSLCALRMISALPTGTSVTISWQSVAGVNYFLERSTNLLGPMPVFTPVAAGVPGQDRTTSYLDTNAVGTGPVFYRVGERD